MWVAVLDSDDTCRRCTDCPWHLKTAAQVSGVTAWLSVLDLLTELRHLELAPTSDEHGLPSPAHHGRVLSLILDKLKLAVKLRTLDLSRVAPVPEYLSDYAGSFGPFTELKVLKLGVADPSSNVEGSLWSRFAAVTSRLTQVHLEVRNCAAGRSMLMYALGVDAQYRV